MKLQLSQFCSFEAWSRSYHPELWGQDTAGARRVVDEGCLERRVQEGRTLGS